MTTKILDAGTQAKLSGLRLSLGDHRSREQGMCIMEATAWIAGEEHSAAPACVCRVLRRFLIRCNDSWSQENRQKLIALIPDLVGTKSTPEVEQKRLFHFCDFACRIILPWLCDKIKKPELAARMRALKAVTDRATAELARQEARSVRDILRAYAAYAYAADADAAYAAYAADAADAAYAADADAADAAYAADAADAAYDADAARSEVVDLCIQAIRDAINIKE